MTPWTAGRLCVENHMNMRVRMAAGFALAVATRTVSAQSLVGTTFASGGTNSDVIIINPQTGAIQRYMTVTVSAGMDVFALGALPDCRLAGAVNRYNFVTAPSTQTRLMKIDTFTGTTTTIDFGAPLNTSFVEGLDYSPRNGALLVSYAPVSSFTSTRLALADPVTGATIATTGTLSAPDLDNVVSGPNVDLTFDLNGASPRVRQVSVFPNPAITSFATPPAATIWFDGAMHPTTGEITLTFSLNGETGSRLVRLVGNTYELGAVVAGGVSVRGLAWANLPPRFVEPIADARVCPTGMTTVVATPVGTDPAFHWEVEDGASFRTLVDGPLVVNGVMVGMAATAGPMPTGGYELTITAQSPDAVPPIRFRAMAMNSCATVASGAFTVSICAGDVNCDGSIDADDLGDFINCYFAQPCARAEVNGDGVVNPDDLGDYINLYFAGGCG